MLNQNNKYSHLYETSIYIPPSVIRKMEAMMPDSKSIFSDININRKKSIESITGESENDRLLDFTLKNKDLYTDMKNKTMYAVSSDIATHSSLNKL